MAALARRLDPCLNWIQLLARTKGRILWIFPALLFLGYLAAMSRSHPVADLMDRLSQRAANGPLLAQARALNLDYERVLAAPGAYAGKPVVWCVSTPAPGLSYVSGRPSWPVALNGSFEDYQTHTGSASYCFEVLAVVTGSKLGLIQLRPVEKL